LRQTNLSEFMRKHKELYKCKYCGRIFGSERGLKIHYAKKHFFYYDEDVEIIDAGPKHIIMKIKLRKTLYRDFLETLNRAKVDIPKFFGEALIFGDALFDDKVRNYITRKFWATKIKPELDKDKTLEKKERQSSYIS